MSGKTDDGSAAMAIDRRVARTRTALYDALVRLIRVKDYDLITVEDILREADVGRSTFYAHFTSKDELLARSLERLRALLVKAREEGESGWSPSRALFEHVAEFADVQFALAGGRGGAIVREAVDEVIAGVLRQWLPQAAGDGIPRELAIRQLVATVNTTMRWWQESHPGMSAAEAEAMFRRLLTNGLSEDICRPFLEPAQVDPERA
jgi:AcrR family transcriptional regulator